MVRTSRGPTSGWRCITCSPRGPRSCSGPRGTVSCRCPAESPRSIFFFSYRIESVPSGAAAHLIPQPVTIWLRLHHHYHRRRRHESKKTTESVMNDHDNSTHDAAFLSSFWSPHASGAIQIGVGSGRVSRSAVLLREPLQRPSANSAPQLQLQSVQLHRAAQIRSQNNTRIHTRVSATRRWCRGSSTQRASVEECSQRNSLHGPTAAQGNLCVTEKVKKSDTFKKKKKKKKKLALSSFHDSSPQTPGAELTEVSLGLSVGSAEGEQRQQIT